VDEETKVQAKMVRVNFELKKGFFGRFDFDTFVENSGLMVLLLEPDSTITRDDLQRFYNALIKMWEDMNFIKFVGHKTVKGQRGRRFKIYEPIVNLNFTWEVQDLPFLDKQS